MNFSRSLLGILFLVSSILPQSVDAQSLRNIVLLPLEVPASLQGNRDVFAAAIQNALRDKFNVFYGSQVEEALRREIAKEDCSAESCVQNLAVEFNGEIIVDAVIKQLGKTFVLSLKFNNVITGQLEGSVLSSCNECDESELFQFIRTETALAELRSEAGLTALLDSRRPALDEEPSEVGDADLPNDEANGNKNVASTLEKLQPDGLTTAKIRDEYQVARLKAEESQEKLKEDLSANYDELTNSANDGFSAIIRGELPTSPSEEKEENNQRATQPTSSNRKLASVDFAKKKEGLSWWVYGLPLLALGGGGGGGGGGGDTSVGSAPTPTPDPLLQIEGDVVKGPLRGATVFLDYNDNGALDTGEPFTLTDNNGSYSFQVENANAAIVVVTDENTVDTSSGEVMSGLILKAPQGSTVITPVTTLFADGDMTEAEVKASLGIAAEVDIKSFNPFKAESGSQVAVKLEKLALQIVSSANAIAKVAQDEGVDQFEASKRAFASIIESIEEKSDNGEQFDFTAQDDLTKIREKAESELGAIITLDADKRTALRGAMETAKSTNETIENLTSLDDEASKNIFRSAARIKGDIDNRKSTDSDNDGIPDFIDFDRDNDGVEDFADLFPDDGTESADLDGDGTGDNADTDRDGDGVANASDAFPNDANETVDTDRDGVGDNADTDRDGDGVANASDAFPNDANETVDTDRDGVGDNADTDTTAFDTPGAAFIDSQNLLGGGYTYVAMPEIRSFSGVAYNYDGTITASEFGLNGSVENLFRFQVEDGLVKRLTIHNGDVDSRWPDFDVEDGADIREHLNDQPQLSFFANLDGDRFLGVSLTRDYQENVNGIARTFFGVAEYSDGYFWPDDYDRFAIALFGGQPAPDARVPIAGEAEFSGFSAGRWIPHNNVAHWTTSEIEVTVDFDRDQAELQSSNTRISSNPGRSGSWFSHSDLDFIVEGSLGYANVRDSFGKSISNLNIHEGEGLLPTLSVDGQAESGFWRAFFYGENTAMETSGNFMFRRGDSDRGDVYIGAFGAADTDVDGDGVANDSDAFPSDASETADLDGDGVGDNADTDRDGDGVANGSDVFPDDGTETADLDSDGIGDNADTDRDGDGVANASDLFPNDGSETADLDSDGIGDNTDPDRDGDGVANASDKFPDDASETADLDNDGIGDNADTDRDGDSVANASDALPDEAGNDIDNDGDRDADDDNNRMPFAASRYGYSNGYTASDYRSVSDADGEATFLTLEHSSGNPRRIQIENNINKRMNSGSSTAFTDVDSVIPIPNYEHLTNYTSTSYAGDGLRMIMGGFTSSIEDDEGLVEYGIFRHDNLDDWGNTDGGDATVRRQVTAFFFGEQAAPDAYQNIDPGISLTGYSTGYFVKDGLNGGDPSVWTTSDISLDIDIQSATFDLTSSDTVTGNCERCIGDSNPRLDFSLNGEISSGNLMTFNSVSRTNTEYFGADLEPYLFSGKLFGEEGLFAGGSFGFATFDSTYLGSFGAYQYGADFDNDGIDNEKDRFVERPQSEFSNSAALMSVESGTMVFLDNFLNREPQHYAPPNGNLVSSQYFPFIRFGVDSNIVTDATINASNQNNTNGNTAYLGHQSKESADIYTFGRYEDSSAPDTFEYFLLDMDLDSEAFGDKPLEFNTYNADQIHATGEVPYLALYSREGGFGGDEGASLLGNNYGSGYLPSYVSFGSYAVSYDGSGSYEDSVYGTQTYNFNAFSGAYHDGIRSSKMRWDDGFARFKGKSIGVFYLPNPGEGSVIPASELAFTTSDIWLDVTFSNANASLYSSNTKQSTDALSWSDNTSLDFEATLIGTSESEETNNFYSGNFHQDDDSRFNRWLGQTGSSYGLTAYLYGEDGDELGGHWQYLGTEGFYQAAFGAKEMLYFSTSEGVNSAIYYPNRLTAINIPSRSLQDRDREYAMHSMDFINSGPDRFSKFSETEMVTNSSNWECENNSCTTLDGLGAEFVHGPNDNDGLSFARFQINHDANFEFDTGSGDTVDLSSAPAGEFTKFISNNESVTVLAGKFDGNYTDFHIYGTAVYRSPNSDWDQRVSSFHDGVRTSDAAIPDAGYYQMEGHSVGVFLEQGMETKMTRSDVVVEVNFSRREVTLNSGGTEVSDFSSDDWQLKSSLNFVHSDLGFNSGVNWITERNQAANFVPDGEFEDGTGSVYANFYGENAEEIGGSWQFNEANKFYQAAFGVKR